MDKQTFLDTALPNIKLRNLATFRALLNTMLTSDGVVSHFAVSWNDGTQHDMLHVLQDSAVIVVRCASNDGGSMVMPSAERLPFSMCTVCRLTAPALVLENIDDLCQLRASEERVTAVTHVELQGGQGIGNRSLRIGGPELASLVLASRYDLEWHHIRFVVDLANHAGMFVPLEVQASDTPLRES